MMSETPLADINGSSSNLDSAPATVTAAMSTRNNRRDSAMSGKSSTRGLLRRKHSENGVSVVEENLLTMTSQNSFKASSKRHRRTASGVSVTSRTSKLSRQMSGSHRRNKHRLEDAAEAARHKLPFGFRVPLCCPEFRLPQWRFSHLLEWRSESTFEGRMVSIAGTPQEKQQVGLPRVYLDCIYLGCLTYHLIVIEIFPLSTKRALAAIKLNF